MDGILNIFKPSGPTSHDVVSYIRKLTAIKKAGHTGTLDPGATGVLVVCLGKATRIIRFLLDDKVYLAKITFGVSTDTGDGYGEIINRSDASTLTVNRLREALKLFKGTIEQVPPMTSAVRHQGQKLYELARRGMTVERKPRQAIIYALGLKDTAGFGTDAPSAHLEVACSAGTYIRTLCADLGKKLGCGAYMSSLSRLRAGAFTIENSLTLERIAGLHKQGTLPAALVSLNEALHHLTGVQVKPDAMAKVKSGNQLHPANIAACDGNIRSGQPVKLLAGQTVLAIARVEENMLFQPVAVLI